MKVLLNLDSIHSSDFGICIGNFDGVHIGHQSLINKFITTCENKKLVPVIITFNPHPAQILRPQKNYLINTTNERSELLSSFKNLLVWEIKFDRDFSTMTPEEFLGKIINVPHLKLVYLGHDFRFGANKSGGFEFIKNFFEAKNIPVIRHDAFMDAGLLVSSSKIRELLKEGNIPLVNKLLGRDFYIRGRVIKGVGRGKKIGFPTANIEYPKDRIVPQNGVYATLTIFENLKYLSLTNIGRNPTFNESDNLHVETHLLDFDTDIYGDELTIKFLVKIRDEQKFNSVNELVEQIRKDVTRRRNDFVQGIL